MTATMGYLIIGLLAVAVLLLIVLLLTSLGRGNFEKLSGVLRQELGMNQKDLKGDLDVIGEANRRSIEQMGTILKERQDSFAQQQDLMNSGVNQSLGRMSEELHKQLDTMYKRMESLESSNVQSLEGIRSSMGENLKGLREENSKKLDEIRGTVDEKLQTTLESRITESFKTVSEQLRQVYQGLGEMQNLASDVGGLKKVLSGVKTRGILGEIQLGAILEEILAPEQYGVNVETVKGSGARVEYAVKLPGPDGIVYLPIDSKFPGDKYEQLVDALASGDKAAIDAAYGALAQVIKNEAQDIKSKYVSVPETTNFGIMFLPFEGLYAEVVNRGLLSELQRKYNVNVAGPSTMAALLNSLQMGFRTLAIQKKSNEVWEVLGAVKTEFGKFEDGMKSMQKHLKQTDEDLEKLLGTRTRAIQRKLREVENLDPETTSKVLALGGVEEEDYIGE